MQSQNDLDIVQDGMVITLDYVLTVNGEVFTTSQDSGPVIFIQGCGQILPGLERAIAGMQAGDRKEFILAASEAYGEIDPEAFVELPFNAIPEDIPLTPGLLLHLENEDGDQVDALVDQVDKHTVRLSLNHPLAGEELHFSVTVVDLWPATQEELIQGYALDAGKFYPAFNSILVL